jgi:hypothetical protein
MTKNSGQGHRPQRSGNGNRSDNRSNQSQRSPLKSLANSGRAGASSAAFDSMTMAWTIATRPWLWVLFPVTVIGFFLLLSGFGNLGYKIFAGEQNNLPVTSDGVVTGSAMSVRSLFGATQEQVLKSVQEQSAENVYSRPSKPSPATEDKAPVQPDVR